MKKTLKTSARLAITAGVVLVAGGIWGIAFTHNNVVREKIISPEDASIPNTLVRGPFTLLSQADIIRHHTLETTGGLTYSEMSRQVPGIDEYGNSIMIPNEARNIWITSTALTTALRLGVITYFFSALIFLLGLISIWTGITFNSLSNKLKKNHFK